MGLLLSLAGAGSGAAVGEERVWDSATRLGELRLFIPPSQQARAFVLLFSDEAGWTARLDVVGRSLASSGVLVGGADLPAYLTALRRGGDACLDLVGEIEDLSWRLQREMGIRRYHGPVLAGAGLGGLLAYAALAQAPAATLTGAVGVDLMRFVPDAAYGTMDFLFAEILLSAKAEGYRWFGLGMAPLSGLPDHRLAPPWSRLGRFMFRHGAHFYNFQGLRAYKEKFGPMWTPVYLLCPPRTLPRVLPEVTALIAGGWGGILRR